MVLDKERFKQDFEHKLMLMHRKGMDTANETEKYLALGTLLRDYMSKEWYETDRRNHEENDRYIEYALKRNLNIAYENMTYGKCPGYCTYIDQLVHLIDTYGDDRIGACLDTGHANMVYADQYEAILKLGHRLHCTHINDNLGKDDLHLPPFSGTVKWETVMKALREINYPGVLNLEIGLNNEAPDDLKDAGAKYSLETLKSLTKL